MTDESLKEFAHWCKINGMYGDIPEKIKQQQSVIAELQKRIDAITVNRDGEVNELLRKLKQLEQPSNPLQLRSPKELNEALASGEVEEQDRLYTVNKLDQQCFSYIHYDLANQTWRFNSPSYAFKGGNDLAFEDLKGWLPLDALPTILD